MKKEDIIGKVFRHYKGRFYFVKDIAKDSEDLKNLVIYQALYGNGEVWSRDVDEFLSDIDPNKLDNKHKQTKRFELVDLEKIAQM